MKRISICLAILFAVSFVPVKTASAQDFKPKLVIQTPDHVFAPMGFDDNDNAQILLAGNFTDTCHKAGPVRFRIDKARKTIYVRNEAYAYSECWCADVMVPYLQTVNIGVMHVGDYDIAVENVDGSFQKMAKVPISLATSSSPDEHLYAPITLVQYKKNQGAESSEIILDGMFRNTCMSLKDIKITYRPNHVIEILPIVNMAKRDCRAEARPFSARVKLKDLEGPALLHVRSLNGQALNQVVDL